jgi:hypothetical protein
MDIQKKKGGAIVQVAGSVCVPARGTGTRPGRRGCVLGLVLQVIYQVHRLPKKKRE